MNIWEAKTKLARGGLVAALLALSGAARAETVRSAAAQRLFDDARELMSESRFAEACPKLAESQRLEPGSGTLLNLAVCHEQQRKTATAWLEYHQVLASSLLENNPDRRQIAEGRIAAIAPTLARIRLELPAATPKGLWIRIDDELLGAEAWQLDVPVDPGRHRVSCGAPGREAASVAIDVVDAGKISKVPLPPLRLAAAAPVRQSAERARADAQHERAGQRRWLLTGASLGIATTAFASMTYFGLGAKSAWADRQRHCTPGCDEEAVAAGRKAQDLAKLANLSLGIGVLGVGFGSYFLFATLAESNGSVVGVGANVSPEQVSLSLRGKL